MRYLLLITLISVTYFFAAARGSNSYADLAVANAGADTVIYKNQTRPDSIFLNGSASTTGQTYHWEQVSGPATVQIQSPDAITSWVTGALPEGFYQFRITINNTVSDTVTAFVRDWQKRGMYP